MTLYFSNAVDSAWDTIGNWWQDAGCSVPAAALPVDGDTAIIPTGSFLSTGPSNPIQPASVQFVSTGGAGTSFNNADLSPFLCVVEFNDTSANSSGGVVRNGRFNDGSVNNPGGAVTNLLLVATFGSGGWRLDQSPVEIVQGGTITNIIVTNIGVVPSVSDVRSGVPVGVPPAVGTLLTYTDPSHTTSMPTEHTLAFMEMLEDFGTDWTAGALTFRAVQSDSASTLEPILEGDFHNDAAPIIALKSAFATATVPAVGDTIADSDGREFRVKMVRTSGDDVTVQFDLTDIHDRG